MSKKSIVIILIVMILSGAVAPVPFDSMAVQAAVKTAAKTAVAKKAVAKKKPAPKPLVVADVLGRLVIETQSENKLWYIEPKTKQRFYLRDDDDLQLIINKFGRTPTAKEFKSIAKKPGAKTPSALLKKYRGTIILNPAATSTAYYLNPADSVAYVIGDFDDFYRVGKVIGIGAPDSLLRQIAMNSMQLAYDPTYNSTAYVKFDGEKYSNGSDSKRILPLASLSKLMTALVFAETFPDWNKVVEITPEEIRYPCTLQACGSTSEIDLKAGDKVRIIDLWVAMLSASSNQSAVILADNSGLSRADFIKAMNTKAKQLGLVKTQFVEMSGLSANNISTAEEFAKITKAAFDNSRIAEATRSVDYVFTVEQADGSPREVKVLNRNYSLLALGPDASKTGFLTEAQRNAAVIKDGVVIVTLHCYSLPQRNEIVKRLLTNSNVSLAD